MFYYRNVVNGCVYAYAIAVIRTNINIIITRSNHMYTTKTRVYSTLMRLYRSNKLTNSDLKIMFNDEFSGLTIRNYT